MNEELVAYLQGIFKCDEATARKVAKMWRVRIGYRLMKFGNWLENIFK